MPYEGQAVEDAQGVRWVFRGGKWVKAAEMSAGEQLRAMQQQQGVIGPRDIVNVGAGQQLSPADQTGQKLIAGDPSVLLRQREAVKKLAGQQEQGATVNVGGNQYAVEVDQSGQVRVRPSQGSLDYISWLNASSLPPPAGPTGD